MFKKVSLIAILILEFSCSSKEKKVKESSKKATLEYQIKATLGEGAIWNYKTKELYWVDIEGKK